MLNSSQLLTEHGIRPSLQRLQVYDYLLNNQTHPTVDTIYSDLAPHIPTLSKTTVYNTLKLFVENKLVQAVPIEDGELRYDADVSEHIHFKCTECESIYDITPQRPIYETALPSGYVSQRSHYCIWGMCPQCSVK